MSNFPDSIAAYKPIQIKLSEIFCFLSPNIIISDPFLLGHFKINSDGEIEVNDSQRIFLNAFIIAIAKAKISKLIFVCDKNKFKDMYKDKAEMMVAFSDFFSQFQQFGLSELYVYISTSFHNRHLMRAPEDGMEDSLKDIYRLSTSINGLVNSGEFEIEKITGINSIKVYSNILSKIEYKEKNII